MKLLAFKVGLAVVNGSMMAIGGFDGSTYLKSCEFYDQESNSWKLSCSMIYRRLGGGVGVITLQRDPLSSNQAMKITNSSTILRKQKQISLLTSFIFFLFQARLA
jgi:hypothetical protein